MTTTTLPTAYTNETIVVEDRLDPQGRAGVMLGLVNQDHSNSFPGRTLTPDQADELAAALVLSAAVARASAGLAPAPRPGDAPLRETLAAIRAAVPLISSDAAAHEGSGELRTRQLDRDGAPEELPISEYDTLKASAIIKQLDDLTAGQLSAVLTYERRHRNRKKVRARIAELQRDSAG